MIVKKVIGTYDTNVYQCPCTLCLCGKEHLNDTTQPLVYRTKLEMKAIAKSMVEVESWFEVVEISKQYSIDAIEECRIIFMVFCQWVFNIFFWVMSCTNILIYFYEYTLTM